MAKLFLNTAVASKNDEDNDDNVHDDEDAHIDEDNEKDEDDTGVY